MVNRSDLVDDMQGVEQILCALEGIGEEIPDKTVIRAVCRCLWHILEFLIRRAKCDSKN